MNQGGIDDGALPEQQTFGGEVPVDGVEQRAGQLVLLQQMTEVEQRGFVGNGVDANAGEAPHGGDFVQAFSHRQVGQAIPLLQAVDAQHGRQRIRATSVVGLGVNRLDHCLQFRPRHDLLHLGQKDFPAGLLFLGSLLEVGEGHLLAHGGVRNMLFDWSQFTR